MTVPGASMAATMAALTVPVAEAFGPTWQGEGPHAGRVCSFLRTGLCNLHCEWCDTPYTWDRDRYDLAAEAPGWSASRIVDTVGGHGTSMLVLTGGEPLIHQTNTALKNALLRLDGHEVHVETNGTLAPAAWLVERASAFAVSPKVAQDADPRKRRIRADVLQAFSQIPHAYLKVVLRWPTDGAVLDAALASWGDWEGRVWVMPEGVDARRLLDAARKIAPLAKARRWHLSLRQQTLLYGEARGH